MDYLDLDLKELRKHECCILPHVPIECSVDCDNCIYSVTFCDPL